ncbi:MAG: DNA polymerase I [Alphaproteobacteria bacterium]|jgi:DNA polymerase I|nr:DNA polymerase I [Alphaproteobacteria bacterium]
MNLDEPYREIWLFDFEFDASDGEQPKPVCLVAKELKSGQVLKLWQDEMGRLRQPPYAIGSDALFIAYYSSAEMGCHLALGWSLPENVLDLFTEFRTLTNGKFIPSGNSLLGALAYFGLPRIDSAEKDTMRDLILEGGPWSEQEQLDILNYCESDVVALEKLLPKMTPHIDTSRALLRGRYMKAVAHIEFNGIPIDTERLELFRDNWEEIQDQLISEVDAYYGVFDGRTFKKDLFANYLIKHDIPWPQLISGSLDLTDDTFKEMSRSYPALIPLRELRTSLSKMRLNKLAVGSDGRNRCLLSPFSSITSRNQPSNSKLIFGPSKWLRGLIQPKPDRGIAYIDWSQQEFGIAAALSGDTLMKKAYESGDPYLAFAKQAGAVPEDATKKSHASERALFKACVLALQYGMGEESLATRIRQSPAKARELIRLHKETYKVFWKWSDASLDFAMLTSKLYTVFGWTVHVGEKSNPRSLRNFPMQANGAEMLRLACILATEKGIKVCAPVHDAILIEAPLQNLDFSVSETQDAMAEASSIILAGFKLSTDAEVVQYPDRYMDEGGQSMWDIVTRILAERGVKNPDTYLLRS